MSGTFDPVRCPDVLRLLSLSQEDRLHQSLPRLLLYTNPELLTSINSPFSFAPPSHRLLSSTCFLVFVLSSSVHIVTNVFIDIKRVTDMGT